VNKKGLLIVVSGPSGAGKGTICKEVLERRSDIFVSTSATTRERIYMEHLKRPF